MWEGVTWWHLFNNDRNKLHDTGNYPCRTSLVTEMQMIQSVTRVGFSFLEWNFCLMLTNGFMQVSAFFRRRAPLPYLHALHVQGKWEASKKSISNLNGNVMSPWWQWISLLINWSCQGQIGKQTYPLASCSTSSLCSLLWKGAGGSLRRVTMVCVCVFAHEMSRSKGDAASTASSVFSWGRLPEKKYKVIPCKHIYTNVNT